MVWPRDHVLLVMEVFAMQQHDGTHREVVVLRWQAEERRLLLRRHTQTRLRTKLELQEAISYRCGSEDLCR